MKVKGFFILLLLLHLQLRAQYIPNVLFIGNSYTEVNNLPQMVSDIATNMGDQMTYSTNTPGGCTFMQHCNNQSMSMIREGIWDIVVLQEQSQLPSFPQWQVEQQCFPYAKRLVDSIYANNPCAEPMFYMTWGRKNGDEINASEFPVLGTYEGMDSMLCERYTYMAEANESSLCPVGRVWRYIRSNHHEIELYASDGSHPSTAGTYAAACAFYVMFFHRDPNNITFNSSLDDTTARIIRTVVKRIVYENLTHWQRPQPQARLSVEIDNYTAFFTNTSNNTDSITCDFGDGATLSLDATEQHFSHTYADSGIYQARLVAYHRCMSDTTLLDVEIRLIPSNINSIHTIIPVKVYPNPTTTILKVDAPTMQHFEMKDLHGCTLITGNTNQVDIGDLPAGIYILQIHTTNGTTSQTVIKRP